MSTFVKRGVALLALLLISLITATSQIDVARVMTIGQNALYFRDYMVAIGYFNKVIALRPWMADPYFQRSLAKLMLDDLQGAESDASLALERNPYITRAYLVRGAARQQMGRDSLAIEDYLVALASMPDDSGLKINLAAAFLSCKQAQQADSLAALLREKDKMYPQAQLIRAHAALAGADTLLAGQHLATALAADSTLADAYALSAQIAFDREQYAEASRQLDHAIRLNGSQADYYALRGLVHYKTDDFTHAISDYSAAIEHAPTHPGARYNRALLRGYLGDLNNARSDFKEVLRMDPDNHLARYNLGLIELELGNYREAVSAFDSVLATYPQFMMGYLARSEALKGLGRYSQAEKDAYRAYEMQRQGVKKVKTAPKASPNREKKTRSEEEEAIERYNELIQNQNNRPSTQAVLESLRGRVQDKQVDLSSMAMLHPAYFVAPTALERLAYSSWLEEMANLYNGRRLLLTTDQGPLSAAEVEECEASLFALEGQALSVASDFLQRAIWRMHLADYEGALIDLDTAIGKDPKLPLAHMAKAYLLVRQHELKTPTSTDEKSLTVSSLELAKKELDLLIAQDPEQAAAYYNRAIVHNLMGQKEKALEDYNRAAQLPYHAAELYYNRALILLSQGRKAEALKDLSRAGQAGIYQAYRLIKKIQ